MIELEVFLVSLIGNCAWELIHFGTPDWDNAFWKTVFQGLAVGSVFLLRKMRSK